jgi:hypothetical protein
LFSILQKFILFLENFISIALNPKTLSTGVTVSEKKRYWIPVIWGLINKPPVTSD